MNFEIIEEFYLTLYGILSKNQNLQNNNCSVYIKVPQQAKYPFITISYKNLNVKKLHEIFQYKIEIEFNLFSHKNNAITSAAHIFNIILEEFTKISHNFEKLDVISSNGNNLAFEVSKDFLIDKISSKFYIILQEKIL